jgi:uncharacterized protein (TIGR02453 family)
MSPQGPYFSPAVFKFLRDLRENNNREWFTGNKDRYIDDVREPAQRFISDFGPRLSKISPHFRADPRPNGGSLFRIYRDVRFAKDKSPYKIYTGIQFRHKHGKDVHAPGFYLHLEPDQSFAGLGIYHPDGPALAKIRQALVDEPARWKRARDGKRLREHFEQGGESLKRAPKGYDPEHPLIEDLKRKDFIVFAQLNQKQITAPDFLERYAEMCKAGSGYIKFLCEAVGVPF